MSGRKETVGKEKNRQFIEGKRSIYFFLSSTDKRLKKLLSCVPRVEVCTCKRHRHRGSKSTDGLEFTSLSKNEGKRRRPNESMHGTSARIRLIERSWHEAKTTFNYHLSVRLLLPKQIFKRRKRQETGKRNERKWWIKWKKRSDEHEEELVPGYYCYFIFFLILLLQFLQSPIFRMKRQNNVFEVAVFLVLVERLFSGEQYQKEIHGRKAKRQKETWKQLLFVRNIKKVRKKRRDGEWKWENKHNASQNTTTNHLRRVGWVRRRRHPLVSDLGPHTHLARQRSQQTLAGAFPAQHPSY